VTIRSAARPQDVGTTRTQLDAMSPAGPTWLLTGQESDDLDLYAEPVGIYGLLNRSSSDLGAARLRDMLESLLLEPRDILAEVRHLRRMIVPPPGDAPVLGLVDEPFRGTNHREQRGATLAIIEHLSGVPGLFLIATHDSTVTQMADGVQAENHHFQEQLGRRELLFDYQLRPGPAQTRNAIRVLEREEYPADLVRRALAHAEDQRDVGNL
jgi:hypothetical protein